MPQKLGSRQLVKRFAQAAGADLQALHSHNQATREFVADVSQRVDALAAEVSADSEVVRAFTSRSFWQRLNWLLTGR